MLLLPSNLDAVAVVVVVLQLDDLEEEDAVNDCDDDDGDDDVVAVVVIVAIVVPDACIRPKQHKRSLPPHKSTIPTTNQRRISMATR